MNSNGNTDLGGGILGEFLLPSGSCIPASKYWPGQQSMDSRGRNEIPL